MNLYNGRLSTAIGYTIIKNDGFSFVEEVDKDLK